MYNPIYNQLQQIGYVTNLRERHLKCLRKAWNSGRFACFFRGHEVSKTSIVQRGIQHF